MSNVTREEIRLQRLKKKRQERLATLLGIGGVILVVLGLILLPSLISQLRPVGEFIQITPQTYPLSDGRAMGNPNATVVIEVFSDYQCSHCKNYALTTEIQLLEDEYITSGQVYYIARQFPMMNGSAQISNASMCAVEQNRFWDYHNMLFTNQNSANATAFSDQRLIAFAEALGLDMDEFNRCFENKEYQADINADINRGIELDVKGTPTIFVNGEKIINRTYDDIITAVETALSLR